MSNKYKVEIFSVNKKDWKFDGKEGTSYTAQMLVKSARDEDGKVIEEVFVARKKLPEQFINIPTPAEYVIELAPFADGNGNLDFRITSLVPLQKMPVAKAAAAAS
ncbi:hypothetical protein R77560_01988 [Ralstonia thomasii]|uniref:Uncharacterized protein n=2 Tax=Ralstonia TaxID=48736 RepID=A0AAD2BR58_9RALS|nr:MULTISPECIES: hypothetical protein [Ralstonia]CAJ0790284.1 hypothetical protein R77560_01988 [Ralstonia sp. LMG 18095]